MTDDREHYAFDDDESERVRRVANWWAYMVKLHGQPVPRDAFIALLEAAEAFMFMSASYQAQRERDEHEREGGHSH